MFMIIGATFAAFFLWRAIGEKLASKNRAQNATLYHVIAVVAFIGGLLGGSKLLSALPLPWPEYPAYSIIISATVVPLICGAVAGFVVWGVVALLPVAPPTRSQRAAAHNPFEDPAGRG